MVLSRARKTVERAPSLKSIIFRFCIIGGVAALVVWMMVLSRARKTEQEPRSPEQLMISVEAGTTPVAGQLSPRAQAMSVQPGAAPGVGPSSSPPQMDQTGSAAVSGPQAHSSQMTGIQTRPALVSRPTSGSVHRNDTVMRLESDELARLLSRAQDLLKSGDFASARLLLRRATEAGDANAALMLGATFDPFFVHAIGPISSAPDIAQARRWYEKAAEFGSEIATERLARLAKSGQ